ncbi:hypothetical protein A2U01_0053025, partial [Trifolium medium]|nr:hypothetical protein [Trifolium medium]
EEGVERRWCGREGLGTTGFEGYILKQRFGLGGGWGLLLVYGGRTVGV